MFLHLQFQRFLKQEVVREDSRQLQTAQGWDVSCCFCLGDAYYNGLLLERQTVIDLICKNEKSFVVSNSIDRLTVWCSLQSFLFTFFYRR